MSYVREIWIGVREKSGKCQGILFGPVCMNPVIKLSFVIKIFVFSIFKWPLKTGFTVPISPFSQSIIC